MRLPQVLWGALLAGGALLSAASSVAPPESAEDRAAIEKWERKLAEREARIREREEELGLAAVGGQGAKNRMKPLEWLGASTKRGAAATQEVLVFEDEFDDLDMDIWQHDITMSGGGNWEFQLYTNNRSNSFVEDGVLYLQPTLTSDTIGKENVLGTKPFRFDMWGMWPSDACTSNSFYGCERISDTASRLAINPVQSARLRTTGTFTFTYGRMEVEAKLPKGDWLWPAIWLLPEKNKYGQWPASGEIDIMESRGNKPGYPKGGYDSFGSCMHWGPFFGMDEYPLTCKGMTLDKSTFNDDFHIFGLVWNEKELYTYLDTDDNRVLEVKFDQAFWDRGSFGKYPGLHNPWSGRPKHAPFDQPFYIIFNVAVGGLSAFFTDGIDNKPWTNVDKDSAYKFIMAQDDWYPSWAGRDSALQIKSVRVWQKPGEGSYWIKNRTPPQQISPSSSAAPSFEPAYHSPQSTYPGHRESGGGAKAAAWTLGALLFVVLAGGAAVYGLYLKYGGWSWGWGGRYSTVPSTTGSGLYQTAS